MQQEATIFLDMRRVGSRRKVVCMMSKALWSIRRTAVARMS